MVLNPELLLVAADVDVILGENESSQPIFERGERGDEFVLFLSGQFPDADFAVLMGGEDFAGAEGDRFDEGGGGGVESVEEGVGDDLVDVDFVA